MPYVNIKVAGDLSRDQKEAIASDVVTSLERHAGKPKDHTYVVFDTVPRDSWAVGDTLLG